MKEFGALAMLFTLIASTAIGVRMLLVARRTRQLPELLFGLAFLCGGLGQGLAVLGQRTLWTEPGSFATTMNTSLFGLNMLGNIALYVVIWRVFRPAELRGAVVTALGIGALLIGFGMRIGGGEFVDGTTYGDGMRVTLAARISIFCWITMEAQYHGAMLFKRARLGLADAMAAAQVRLWGVAGLANMLLSVMIAYYTLELHRSPLEDFWPVCAILVLVTVSVTTMWIAFFPPAGLAARVRARISDASVAHVA